ncbi:copper homeostasis protein [Bisgaardia hudsonensis]|uniref:PF03932 family protein CutC n=1 Tax=Bisgaardia hudsonensis TaxID=109472 RepID=A0A4R2MXB7_9PAST|nr:copper homeostasis protein CutC [Bisgaardia hudsonensis]QLB12197.1 copper homeostasis protein CutC [Bisgaardia hudsonensis]TCP12237.1 copper homeostasis protein [Bisgaardia hudsonensis]
MKIEVCIDNIESLFIAQQAGADRIELCGSLALGGVTPPYSLIESAVKNSTIPINLMIRPRAGDFLFNQYEIDMMIADIQMGKSLGVSGVVIGTLTKNAEIDLAILEKLIDSAYNLDITFHRAFDLCKNPHVALEQLIQSSCKRILTSGQANNAYSGREMITALVKQADNRISIMAGAGINIKNAQSLAVATNVQELHLSGTTYRKSLMKWQSNAVMGKNQHQDQQINITDFNKIQQIVQLFTPHF